jgi:hypothetical protein
MALGDLICPQESYLQKNSVVPLKMIDAKRRPAAQNSRAVEFGEIVKLLRDVIGQSLKAHLIGSSPQCLGRTVEKGLCFSRLSNLFSIVRAVEGPVLQPAQ